MITEAPNRILKKVHPNIFDQGTTEATRVLYVGNIEKKHRQRTRFAIVKEGLRIDPEMGNSISTLVIELLRRLPQERIDEEILNQAAIIEVRDLQKPQELST